MFRAIILLPGTVLLFIPGVILWAAEGSQFSPELSTPHQTLFWLALLTASMGLGLSGWTVTLFKEFGEGTPAPWDPPKKLVVRGPYRHVRNPMIIGVILMLIAEAMLFRSWPIVVWMVLFFIGNTIYFPVIEEKGLEKKFGDNYRDYKAHVPRWRPRLRAWKQTKES
ncbi:MAG: methyltransferase family protein [Candidatus Binatia bacterium]